MKLPGQLRDELRELEREREMVLARPSYTERMQAANVSLLNQVNREIRRVRVEMQNRGISLGE